MRESKIFYLDKDNNITEKELAVKTVIQVFENELLVEEVWSYNNTNEDEVVDDGGMS